MPPPQPSAHQNASPPANWSETIAGKRWPVSVALWPYLWPFAALRSYTLTTYSACLCPREGGHSARKPVSASQSELGKNGSCLVIRCLHCTTATSLLRILFNSPNSVLELVTTSLCVCSYVRTYVVARPGQLHVLSARVDRSID